MAVQWYVLVYRKYELNKHRENETLALWIKLAKVVMKENLVFFSNISCLDGESIQNSV